MASTYARSLRIDSLERKRNALQLHINTLSCTLAKYEGELAILRNTDSEPRADVPTMFGPSVIFDPDATGPGTDERGMYYVDYNEWCWSKYGARVFKQRKRALETLAHAQLTRPNAVLLPSPGKPS